MFQESIEEIITRDIISVTPGDTLSHALYIMSENRISFLVVASRDNMPVGVITESDIVRMMSSEKSDQCSVQELMSTPVQTISLKEDAFVALHLFLLQNIRHLVVVDNNGHIAGVLTLTDFLHNLGFEYFVEIKNVLSVITQKPVTLGKNENVKHTISLMAKRKISCVVVVEDEKPIGIFTERDVTRIYCRNFDLAKTKIHEVMTFPIESIVESFPLMNAITLMREKQLRHLIVIDEKNRLSGILNQLDVTRSLDLKYTEFLQFLIAQQKKDLLNANNSLEEKIKERTAELEDVNKKLLIAKDEAELASQAKSNFLSVMSHELKTPMNGVLGITQLMLSDEERNQKDRESLNFIYKSGQALVDILNNILDVTNLESKSLRVKYKKFSLMRELDKVVNLFAVSIESKGLTFTKKFPESMPETLIGDSTRLVQILSNLLGNAVKFTKKGTIELTVFIVSESEKEIELLFEVSDSGIGIPQDELENIFYDFFQIDSSISRGYQGMGLGLSIVKNMTILMGGKVKVKSEKNIGSTFSITLPFNKAEHLRGMDQ